MQRDIPMVLRPKKPDVRCRKHPKHLQSPGVCSICLREKLARLLSGSGTSSTSFRGGARADDSSYSSSSSLSPYESSSSASSTQMSPLRRYRSVKGPGLQFGRRSDENKDALTKSRSIAFFTRNRTGSKEEDGENHDNKHKVRFWSRLIPRRGRRRVGLKRV
ncbi:hypothetical protein SAY87_022210 [Trapa incisa]|uniref:Uncharacterized protein n=1 Tax=Trapa incisa TaxID=236973 RepID=A0AAN7JUD1_9MYRT|nr:hypothetical protein SAY87_022210 [Trapa incisa]